MNGVKHYSRECRLHWLLLLVKPVSTRFRPSLKHSDFKAMFDQSRSVKKAIPSSADDRDATNRTCEVVIWVGRGGWILNALIG